MANERGNYGQAAAAHEERGLLPVLLIGGGIMAVIIGVSPGVRHFFKHGYLPHHHDHD